MCRKRGQWDLVWLEKGDPAKSEGTKTEGHSGTTFLPPSSMGVTPSPGVCIQSGWSTLSPSCAWALRVPLRLSVQLFT